MAVRRQRLSGESPDESCQNDEWPTYEVGLKRLGLTTLGEHRHRLDMIPTYKIVTIKYRVRSHTLFRWQVPAIGQPDRWRVLKSKTRDSEERD
jgi:hypothetical protein